MAFSDIFQSIFPAAAWEAAWASFLLFLPRLAVSLTIILAFWMIGSGVARGIRRLGRNAKVEVSVVNLLAQAGRISVIAFAVVTALGTLGIDITALVASLGLAGLALGLALKEIVSNALSGILVIIYKPFRQGDVIAVSTFEGTVREINLRYTTLSTEGKVIFIPNAMVISNAVLVRRPKETGLPGV